MALDKGCVKTEHNGAKHGQGAWCPKEDAKRASRKRRRRADQRAAQEGVGTIEQRVERLMKQFPITLAYLARND